ncbi:DUF5074 domain-containing protein [Barnesiella viscericola]|uniref:DUF5074 domain-containing protein n=1 Tax=Barnesiella viscericola TaxID=397865 RepID=UPI0024B773DC|nr:DUF5074 domain-containing protein [Barnesiella viscericola]
MNNRWITALFLTGVLVLTGGCSSDPEGINNGGNAGGGTNPPTALGGYASPDGVLVLNQGAPRLENGSVTWISPDGVVEQNVYRTVNGSACGNTSQDLYLYGNKIYIMSNNTEVPDLGNSEPGDGAIVIVNAETFQREKVFQFKDLMFHKPEGSLEEVDMLPLATPLENLAVIDEHNLFLADGQGMFRLDTETGVLTIVEGGYHFGNQGNTIETVVGTRGMTVIGDHLYCSGGGFWTNTQLFEFTKDCDRVTRSLDLSGEFISGICRTGDHEIVVATCGRSGSLKSYLTFVDTETMSVKLEKPISADISAELMNSSGVTLSGDYLYFAAGTLTVSRISLKTWKIEEYIQVKNDAPQAQYLTCNVVADPGKNLLYVSVSNDLNEARISDGNILVYDCSDDEPKLVMNIENKASYPVNIYPMSKFY